MKIIVIGHKQHGKGTFASIASDEFGIPSMGTSRFNANYMFELMKKDYGFATAEECYSERYKYREIWFNELNLFCKDNPAQIIEDILVSNDICEGPRNRIEFECAKKRGSFDLVIWVDASKRKAKEDTTSMELNQDDADIIITNNESKSEFKEKVHNLLKVIFPK